MPGDISIKWFRPVHTQKKSFYWCGQQMLWKQISSSKFRVFLSTLITKEKNPAQQPHSKKRHQRHQNLRHGVSSSPPTKFYPLSLHCCFLSSHLNLLTASPPPHLFLLLLRLRRHGRRRRRGRCLHHPVRSGPRGRCRRHLPGLRRHLLCLWRTLLLLLLLKGWRKGRYHSGFWIYNLRTNESLFTISILW